MRVHLMTVPQFQYNRKSVLLGSMGLKRVIRISKNIFQYKTKSPSPDVLSKKAKSQKSPTSGSDLSETHNELTLNAQNRNSSSG